MSEISVFNYFDTESATWHEKIRPGDRERLYQIFCTKVKVIKKPVLDAGCGTGILLPVLSKLNLNIFPLYEVDLSQHMLIKNREFHQNKFLSHYLQANVCDLPFKANFFQTIISFASFPHFNPRDQVLEEFWRVLIPGGIFVILHLMGSENLNMMHEKVGGIIKGDQLPHINHLSIDLEIRNFKVLQKEDNNDLYLLIAQK